MPLGAWNLWPDMLSMSMPMAFTSILTLPMACTASVWKSTPCFLHTAASSAMGSMVPISLLAVMMDTSVVSGRMAASSCSGVTKPYSSTGR